MFNRNVDIFPRMSSLMHRVWSMEHAQAAKVNSGAYDGDPSLLEDDVRRLQMAKIRCDILFEKLKEVDWIIPAEGDLIKELEECEFHVTTASIVVKD